MNLSRNQIKAALTILIIGLSLAVISCDNPADSGEEHHEHIPVGAVLFLNGQEIVRYENGEINGEITITAGHETPLITLQFIAEDGDLFQPDEPGYSLGWEMNNTTVAEVKQHAEYGKWKFHIHGIKAGSAEIIFQLLHGDGEDAHSDFNTLPIPVIVNNP